MRRYRKFCQSRSNFDNVFFYFFFFAFLVDEGREDHEGREDPRTTISRQSSARQRNTIKWCFAGMPMMAQHLMLASKLQFSGDPDLNCLKPNTFVIFQGGGGSRPPDPPLDRYMIMDDRCWMSFIYMNY